MRCTLKCEGGFYITNQMGTFPCSYKPLPRSGIVAHTIQGYGKIKRDAKKTLGGQYESNPVFTAIVAMDSFLSRAKIQSNFLEVC